MSDSIDKVFNATEQGLLIVALAELLQAKRDAFEAAKASGRVCTPIDFDIPQIAWLLARFD